MVETLFNTKNRGEIIIAVDAMGGDKAPRSTIEGVNLIVSRYNSSKKIKFLLFGDKSQIEKIISKDAAEVSKIIHTDKVILGDEKPTIALRSSKGSSMRMAIEAVKNGEAHASISAGNTGALMAISKLVLRAMPGVHRPAICGIFPTEQRPCAILDMGANIDCSTRNLVQFAVMGAAFASSVIGHEKPRVAILNVGTEDIKGFHHLQEASSMLKESYLKEDFKGYIEADQIITGNVDVIVTDGFSGNVLIKTAEGAGKLIRSLFKNALQESWLVRIGLGIAGISLKKSLSKMDPRNYNGAILLGLNGISVKSHGGTDGYGFANAIEATIDLISYDINKEIEKNLKLSGWWQEEGVPNDDAAKESQ